MVRLKPFLMAGAGLLMFTAVARLNAVNAGAPTTSTHGVRALFNLDQPDAARERLGARLEPVNVQVLDALP